MRFLEEKGTPMMGGAERREIDPVEAALGDPIQIPRAGSETDSCRQWDSHTGRKERGNCQINTAPLHSWPSPLRSKCVKSELTSLREASPAFLPLLSEKKATLQRQGSLQVCIFVFSQLPAVDQKLLRIHFPGWIKPGFFR